MAKYGVETFVFTQLSIQWALGDYFLLAEADYLSLSSVSLNCVCVEAGVHKLSKNLAATSNF